MFFFNLNLLMIVFVDNGEENFSANRETPTPSPLLLVQEDVPRVVAQPSMPSHIAESNKSIHNTNFKEIQNPSLKEPTKASKLPPLEVTEAVQHFAPPPPRLLPPLSPPPRLSDLPDEPTTTTPIASMNSLNHSRKFPSPKKSKSSKSSRKVKKSSIISSQPGP